MECIMIYICTHITLALSNDVFKVPHTGLVNLSSINHIIKKNEHVYTFMQIFILIKAYIMFYVCVHISLVLSNDDSEEPDTGLVNLSSINHTIKTNSIYIHSCKWLNQS